MVRVVIADDHPILVRGLRVALAEAGLDVVGAASSGAAVVGLVEATQPDVVLLDLHMPGVGGLECLAELRRRMPDVKVIVFSGDAEQSSIDAAISRGASCYVVKGIDAEDLAAIVRIIASKAPIYYAAGNVATDSEAPPEPVALPSARDRFTRRELELLQLVAAGLSNGEIARKLWVSQPTVKFHLSNIYRKLGVVNRTQAASRARTLGLVADGSPDAVGA